MCFCRCIEQWFKKNRSCPEHPNDWASSACVSLSSFSQVCLHPSRQLQRAESVELPSLCFRAARSGYLPVSCRVPFVFRLLACDSSHVRSRFANSVLLGLCEAWSACFLNDYIFWQNSVIKTSCWRKLGKQNLNVVWILMTFVVDSTVLCHCVYKLCYSVWFYAT